MAKDCSADSKSDKLVGNITCPECKHVQAIGMPTISCLAFYKCDSCNNIISAKDSCCVFCDYGDRKCPIKKFEALN